MIKICKDKRLETVYGLMFKDNYRAIELMKKTGFTTKKADQGTVKATLNLEEDAI